MRLSLLSSMLLPSTLVNSALDKGGSAYEAHHLVGYGDGDVGLDAGFVWSGLGAGGPRRGRRVREYSWRLEGRQGREQLLLGRDLKGSGGPRQRRFRCRREPCKG